MQNQSKVTAWLAVFGGILATFMSIVDIQITNAAVGIIQNAMNAPLADGSWITGSYLIAEIIAIPITNFWLNWLGLRRTSILFCLLFIIGSILCSEALNLQTLILFRAVQGFSAGILMSLSYVIIMQVMKDKQDKQLAIIIFGAIIALSPTIGPLLGGILINHFSWKILFYINIPFAILSIIMLLIGLKPMLTHMKNKIDIIGIISIAIGLGCLQYVLEEGFKQSWLNSNLITICSITAIIAFGIFIINELKVKQPLVDLGLFANIKFTIACLGSFFAGMAIFSFYFIVPYYLVIVYNYDVLQITHFLVWIGITQIFTLLFARYMLNRANIYLMIAVGFLLFSASVYIWGTFIIGIVNSLLILSAVLRGISSTFFLTPLGVMATTSVNEHDAPSASCLYNISRSLGGAIGVAAVTTYVAISQREYFSKINDNLLSYQYAFADLFNLLAALLFINGIVFVVIYIWNKIPKFIVILKG